MFQDEMKSRVHHTLQLLRVVPPKHEDESVSLRLRIFGEPLYHRVRDGFPKLKMGVGLSGASRERTIQKQDSLTCPILQIAGRPRIAPFDLFDDVAQRGWDRSALHFEGQPGSDVRCRVRVLPHDHHARLGRIEKVEASKDFVRRRGDFVEVRNSQLLRIQLREESSPRRSHRERRVAICVYFLYIGMYVLARCSPTMTDASCCVCAEASTCAFCLSIN